MISLEIPQRKCASSRLEGRTSWIFSSCGRCSRLTTGTSGTRCGGLRKGERNSRVVPPFPESPRCLSPFQGKLFSLHCLDIQAEDRLTPRWHVGQPFGKELWESLVGKSHGKASRESHISLDPREGKRDTAATAREESARACHHLEED